MKIAECGKLELDVEDGALKIRQESGYTVYCVSIPLEYLEVVLLNIEAVVTDYATRVEVPGVMKHEFPSFDVVEGGD